MNHFAVVGTLLVGAATALAAPVSADDLRIAHVTIVSPERASPLNDADVAIQDGRIFVP
jgi:hypothetical protein